MRRVVISGMISNTLEWYSYALYGYFTSIISKLFFPLENQYLSLIATFGVFAAGFMMRPVGAAIFGYLGDKCGRRVALASSVLLMAIPTTCIGLLSTYDTIGIAAPLLLTLIRLLQGLALGGAFSGSMTFLVEHAADNKRGIIGSTTMFSMILGLLCGAITAAIAANSMPASSFEAWGWRIPFLLAFPAGLVGLYIRTRVIESPKYTEIKATGCLSSQPVKDVFRYHLREILVVMGVILSLTVPFYTLTVFMNSFLVTILGHSVENAMYMNVLNMLVLLVTIPASAWLSDKIGRKKVLIAAAFGYIIFSYPVFMLLTQDGIMYPLIAQLIFSCILGCFSGPLPAMMVESFPTKLRYSGMAISYNLSISIFGGTAPMLSTWLIAITGINAIFAFYIILCAVVSLVALHFYQDRRLESL